MSNPVRPRIGVSACLLGKPVRFDGGHKRSDFVADVLARFVDFVPVCPELESGMPVARESLRLVKDRGSIRVLGNRSGDDYTDRVATWVQSRLPSLGELNLDGFILKKDSPSCGIERVRLYRDRQDRQPARNGTGLFAAALRERFPSLPMTEEGWLYDASLRESFLGRVFTHHRMRASLLVEPSRAALVAFHTEHKLLYMAHSPRHCRGLGRVVASVAERPLTARSTSIRLKRWRHSVSRRRQANRPTCCSTSSATSRTC